MARHRKEYEGERLTARLPLQMAPSDRTAIEIAAAEQGITASEFGRSLVLNGLRAYRAGSSVRAAHRQKVVRSVERLTEVGDRLNQLARMGNREKHIGAEASVVAVCAELVDLFHAIPPRMTGAPKDPETKRLVALMAAIGNNVQQLKKLARSRLNRRSELALKGVEAVTVKIEKALIRVDAELAQTLGRVLPP